jgi:hypothetical protein
LASGGGIHRSLFYDVISIQNLLLAWKEFKRGKIKKKDVGNFKSYAGMKYKLHYDYDEDGYVLVAISFISSTKTALPKKESIISFIESTKMKPKDK